jgi:hypothetical protein
MTNSTSTAPVAIDEEPTVPVPAQTNRELVFGLYVDHVQQAREAMSYNGHAAECLPHLACGGIGCDACLSGARRCAVCMHRAAVATVEGETTERMDLCGWCRDEAVDEELAQAAALAEERGAA